MTDNTDTAAWLDKYLALDEDDQRIIDELLDNAIDTVSNKSGTIVMLTDPQGNGRANFLYGGNPLLVEGLLEAGAELSKEYFHIDRGMMN